MVGCLHPKSRFEALIYIPDCYTRHTDPSLINDCILCIDCIGHNPECAIIGDALNQNQLSRNLMFLLFFIRFFGTQVSELRILSPRPLISLDFFSGSRLRFRRCGAADGV
jgi:hypothetical protein